MCLHGVATQKVKPSPFSSEGDKMCLKNVGIYLLVYTAHNPQQHRDPYRR
jgi:hypothetical protein